MTTFGTVIICASVLAFFVLFSFVPIGGTCIGIGPLAFVVGGCGEADIGPSIYLLPAASVALGILTIIVGSSAGCLLTVLLICAVGTGAAVYLAVQENRSFPGSDTIRTVVHSFNEQEATQNSPSHDAPTRRPPKPISIPGVTYDGTALERANVTEPQLRHAELKRLLLDLTNQERAAHGAPVLKLGNNTAAQLHAEAALEGCYSSHWDRWGLKSNHRYTLAGGTGADAENVSGSSYCIRSRDNYTANSSMELEIAETVQGWMDSPGHRRSLLNPAHTELNVGIAHDRYNTVFVQHFASDYVRYDQRPAIDQQGLLTLSATVSGATLQIDDSVNVQIAYDPPPQPLTRGQLSYTYSLCLSTPAAYIVESLPPGWHFNDSGIHTTTVQHGCVDPYHTPADHPAPSSNPEAHRHWAEAKNASAQASAVQVQTVRVIAQMMTVTDTVIQVQTDLSQVLAQHGPGIYTVIIWGRPNHMTEIAPLSEQAIFWLTRPPPEAPY